MFSNHNKLKTNWLQLAQSLNQVHRINEIHRKRKWRWRHRQKMKAIGISALLFLTTCVLRSTVTYSKVSPPDATSYDCNNEGRYESWPLQIMQLRLAIDVDCWFERCYLTDAPCCSVKLLPADNWQADGTWPQTHCDKANSASNGQTTVQLKTHPAHLQCAAISDMFNSRHAYARPYTAAYHAHATSRIWLFHKNTLV